LDDIAVEGGGCTCTTTPKGRGVGALGFVLVLSLLHSLRRRSSSFKQAR
jgi:MYXO-CTERM domain-containing protein